MKLSPAYRARLLYQLFGIIDPNYPPRKLKPPKPPKSPKQAPQKPKPKSKSKAKTRAKLKPEPKPKSKHKDACVFPLQPVTFLVKPKRLSSSRRRKLREQNAGRGYTECEWLLCKKQYGYRCLRCGSKERLVPDHVIPLFRGGRHLIENIQPLCWKCNRWKGIRVIEFRPSRLLPSPQ